MCVFDVHPVTLTSESGGRVATSGVEGLRDIGDSKPVFPGRDLVVVGPIGSGFALRHDFLP